jgi:sucrose phosphorylase
MGGIEEIKNLLYRIYGEQAGNQALEKVRLLIDGFPKKTSEKTAFFSQEDVILITYGDSLHREGQAPIGSLHDFAKTHLKGAISTIHFLPFFPFSSDDGFSVMDFHAII